MQVKYNLQILWSISLDLSTRLRTQMCISPIVHFKRNISTQICRRRFSQQSSLLLGKSPVFFWRPLILKYSVWCKNDILHIHILRESESWLRYLSFQYISPLHITIRLVGGYRYTCNAKKSPRLAEASGPSDVSLDVTCRLTKIHTTAPCFGEDIGIPWL